MRNFQSNNRRGFGRRRPNANRFSDKSRSFNDNENFNRGRNNRRSREMHNVICSKCGVNCLVPFKPTNNKPVYCNDCFTKNDESGTSFSSRNQNSSTQSMNSSDQFNIINKKLDKILGILSELELTYDDEDLKIVSDDEDSDSEDEDIKDSDDESK